MPLLVYNKTTSLQTVPVIQTLVPQSPMTGARGEGVDVTSELRGRSDAIYAQIQAKVEDGTFDFEWTDNREFPTGSLVTLLITGGEEVTTIVNVQILGESGAPLGSTTNPLIIEPAGMNPQPAKAGNEEDSFFASTGPMELAPSEDSTIPVFALVHAGESLRTARFLALDMFIKGSGDSVSAGMAEFTLLKIDAVPAGTGLPIGSFDDIAAAAEMLALMPTEFMGGTPLFSWLWAGSHSDHKRWSLDGLYKRMTFRPESTSGLFLGVRVLSAMAAPLTISVSAYWAEA